MVVYLPTILMNMINQATNYITGDTKYDLIYAINITCISTQYHVISETFDLIK